jgi:uncharacterized protein (TIGR03067 family)
MTPLLCLVLALTASDDEANKKDLEKMQSDWVMASMVRDSEKIPDLDAQALFRSMKGNEYTVYRFDREAGKGTFKLQADQKPKKIDFYPANAPDKSKPMLGIYEFDGERLRFCLAPPGQPRPTEFASKQGQMRTLAVWEREKK